MFSKRMMMILVLVSACYERQAITAPAGMRPVASRAAPEEVARSPRERALTQALLSRYSEEQRAALNEKLNERNGVSKIVQLNDPDSQRLFDQIFDTRMDERAQSKNTASPRTRFRRVVIALSGSEAKDQSPRVIKRRAKLINGQMVEAQYVLLLPVAAVTDEDISDVLDAARSHIARFAVSATADTSVRIVWQKRAASSNGGVNGNRASNIQLVKDGPIQVMDGIGLVRTYPMVVDLTP